MSWSVELVTVQRSGELVYREQGRELRVSWEMSGTPRYDILIAPLRLSRWTEPSDAPGLPLARQLVVLERLREWLKSNRIRADVFRSGPPNSRGEICASKDCESPALEGSALCGTHFDRALLLDP